MSDIKTITVKKSTLATFRGLGLSNEEIADRVGITKAEVASALDTFGMTKKRDNSKGKTYQINLVDDTKEIVAKPEVASEEPKA